MWKWQGHTTEEMWAERYIYCHLWEVQPAIWKLRGNEQQRSFSLKLFCCFYHRKTNPYKVKCQEGEINNPDLSILLLKNFKANEICFYALMLLNGNDAWCVRRLHRNSSDKHNKIQCINFKIYKKHSYIAIIMLHTKLF